VHYLKLLIHAISCSASLPTKSLDVLLERCILKALFGGKATTIMDPPSLLFVNENLQSRHREPRSKSSIQRHVQRYHADKSRRQKNAALKGKLQKTQELLGWLERDRPESLSLVVEQDECQKLCGKPKAHENKATNHESRVVLNGSKSPSLLPSNPLVGTKYTTSLPGQYFGSFAFTNVEYDEMVHRSIQYFTSDWKPFACKCDVDTPLFKWPGKIDSAHCSEHILSMNEIVRRCLHDKMHMYSLIATCARRIRSVDKDIVEHIDNAEMYMARAINLLRNFLKETPVIDEQVIIDIYFLSTFEFYIKNYNGAQIYLRIIKSMVEILGGFRYMGEYARRLCWNGDISVALEHPSQPILPPIWTPQPTITSAKEQTVLEGTAALTDGMGSAFQEHKDFLSPELLAIVAEICSNAKLLKSTITTESHLDTQTVFERGTSLLHRLLSCGPNSERRDHLTLKEDCCRYALALWVWNIFIRGAANVGVDIDYAASTDVTDARQMRPIIARQLKQTIFRACEYANECVTDTTQYRLRLWIIGVGISGAEPGKARDWYTDFFWRLANALQIRTIEQVSNVFRGYVYLQEFECCNMKRLADLLSRQPYKDLRTAPVLAHG
jgi:hypothetical protein